MKAYYVVRNGWGQYLQGFTLQKEMVWTSCQRCAVRYNRDDAHRHAHESGRFFRVTKVVPK